MPWLFWLIGLAAASGLGSLSVAWSEFSGFKAHEYFPFFLNPAINPLNTDPAILTPNFELKGGYWLVGLMLLTLFLNILVNSLTLAGMLMLIMG